MFVHKIQMLWLSRFVWAIIMAFGLIFAPPFLGFASAPESALAVPLYLQISSINLNSSIIPVGWTPIVINGQTYGLWDTADNEVGWHNLSASLGQVGNTVLAGHSNINSRVFQNLEDVQIGDEVAVHSGVEGQPYRYVVSEKVLLQEVGVPLETRIQNAQWIAPTDDERLTLVTCSQPGATHRLVVVARPVAGQQQ